LNPGLDLLVLSLGLLLLCSSFAGQSSNANGELKVTAMVVTSTAITFAANGTHTVVVANAPAGGATLLALTELQPALKPKTSSYKKMRNRLVIQVKELPQPSQAKNKKIKIEAR
jgi:hypothetical protein